MHSVQFSRSVMSDSLRPHESQHARPPCPSPTLRVYSNSCPLSRWCHPAISSSVVPFSSCPQSLLASGPFPMSQLSAWGGQITTCKIDREFAVRLRTQTGALDQPWDQPRDGEMGESFKREGIYVYLWMIRSDRKQQNSIKQLSFNKKQVKKKVNMTLRYNLFSCILMWL